jgi:hypothetical protein
MEPVVEQLPVDALAAPIFDGHGLRGAETARFAGQRLLLFDRCCWSGGGAEPVGEDVGVRAVLSPSPGLFGRFVVDLDAGRSPGACPGGLKVSVGVGEDGGGAVFGSL